ncbi:MAG: EFR1 family ferrodoxin, partial [bacterium]
MVREILIYYFSATGNTLRIVKGFCEELEKNNIIPTTWKIENGVFPIHNEFQLLCFAYPVHAWGMPLIVEEFLKNMPSSNGKKAFVIATMAGWRMKFKLGENFILSNAKRKLERLGLEFIGGKCFVMPENFSIMYNPPDKTEAKNIIEKSVIEAREFAQNIKLGTTKRRFIRTPDFFIWCAINKLFKLGKTCGAFSNFFKVNDNCNSCGICEKCCPT